MLSSSHLPRNSMSPSWLWIVLSMIAVVKSATLFNGLQSTIISSSITTACDAAFNPSITCSENVVQLITYPIQSVGWNTSTLMSLCTADCKQSLADLATAVQASCDSDQELPYDNQNMTYVDLVDYVQYKYGLICLADSSTGDFCLDVEASWNITTMSLANDITWPTHTYKCYYDASLGTWTYSNDGELNATCTEPFYFQWDNATDSAGLNSMAAWDYYIEKPDPIDDDNYGWRDPLEFDEYPLEIQCSSCFLNKFKNGFESSWGDIWDDVTDQVWVNMQQNCALDPIIVTASNNFSGRIDVDSDVQTSGPITTTCPQTIILDRSTALTCTDVSIQYDVPTAGLMNLNSYLPCDNLAGRTLCAPLSCPVLTVSLNSTSQLDDTMDIPQYVTKFANFTLSQFYAWNPYIGYGFLNDGDIICIGPPGGLYIAPSATVAVPSVYTTTAIPSSPTPFGTIPNCGLHYLVQPGDDCNKVCEAYGLTFSEFINLNPSIDSACSNLLAYDDYCVAPVNGSAVANVTTTLAPSNPTSSSSSPTSQTSSATSTFVAPPAATVAGTTSECYQWYELVAGDTCYSIEQAYGITFVEFQALNTYIDTTCSNLWATYSCCVSGIPE